MMKRLLTLASLAAALPGCTFFQTSSIAERTIEILRDDCREVFAEYPEMKGMLVEVAYALDAPATSGGNPDVHFRNVFQKAEVKHGVHAWVRFEHGFRAGREILGYEEHLSLYTDNLPFDADQVVVPLSGALLVIREKGLRSDDPETVTLCRPQGFSSPQYRYGSHLVDAVTGELH